MIKYLILLANTIGVLFYHIYLGNDVTIRHNIPSVAQPGSTFVVAFQITKNDISGFGKLQLDIPEGIQVEAVERLGASFTFTDNRVKLIWFKLPPEKDITVSLKFIVDPTLTGTQTLAGKFSYMNANQERKFEEIVPKKIKILYGDGQAAIAGGGRESQGTGSDPFDQANVTVVSGVSAQRQMGPAGENTWNVEVLITKDGIDGFGRLVESVTPYAFEAEQTKGAGCSFEFDKISGNIIFSWPELPPEDKLIVGYKLILKDQTLSGQQSVMGEFDFLIDGTPARETVYATTFNIRSASPPPVASGGVTQDPQGSQIVSSNPGGARSTPPQASRVPRGTIGSTMAGETRNTGGTKGSTTDRSTWSANKPANKPPPSRPRSNNTTGGGTSSSSRASASGVSYGVQISAGHKSVENAYFRSRHSFSGKYNIEHHEGWIKYTTGSFETYRQGRDSRVQLDTNYDFPGPFVTAYNDGVRITVQEALMISNQRWVP